MLERIEPLLAHVVAWEMVAGVALLVAVGVAVVTARGVEVAVMVAGGAVALEAAMEVGVA